MEPVNQDVIVTTPIPDTPTSGYSYEYESDGEGGVKKIIYNGSTKKRNLFDNDDTYSQQWNYKTQQGTAKQPGQQFNLDDVWSIKRNVGVNKSPIANPAGGSFWERGAGKGYYSRHGGLADEENSMAATSTQGGSGGNYQQNKNYSYSYSSADRLQTTNGTGSNGTSPRGGNSLNQGPTNNIMNGSGMMTNGGFTNGHSANMGPTPTNMGHSRHGGPVSSRYQGPVANNKPRKF